MNHAVVQRWLRSVLGPYADRDRVFADVDRALIAVSSLSPKTEVFTFNDGRTQLLLTLDGTIPVEFRNTTYNIPVAYWIPQDYPREPPMAFVAPTPDMAIRKGPHVDPSGEIGGEYLARWRSKPEACNLLDLIHDCQQMFGREPPVYAKPKPTPVYATAATPQHRFQPLTPQQATSSNAFIHRSGSPSLLASPRSPETAAGPSFHSPSTHDPRQKPPPPAPGPSGSQEPSQAPHRPPKPSSSLGPDGAIYAHSPRNSMSHTDPYGSPAPLPARDMQSPQQTGSQRVGGEEAYRRLSGPGYAPAAFHPSQNATPPRLQYAPSPTSGPHSPSPASQWQPHAQDHQIASNQRHGSQQFPQHQQQQQQQHQPQQRSRTYPSSDSNAGFHPGVHQPPYNGSAVPHQPNQSGPPAQHQPPNGPGVPPLPPVPGPHPYQPAHLAGPASTPAANGYRDSPQPPFAAPKPKGISLLDEDDASTSSGFDSSPNAVTLSHPAGTTAPPPPRPINPELLALHDRLFTKIDSRLSTLASTLQASNARLEVLSSDLDRGLPAIEDEMSRLKAVRDVCQTTGDRLASSVNEITESVRTLQAREDPDPDSMVLATSIVGNQLVDLVAEDNAIEDTLYHLGRALNAERIDLDRFLKQTRMLAREQFMRRALAMKISEGMGWAQ
ncbi:related to Tumor susceptibility gene 101 protein [Ustilago trichophora]|uniref:Related to Tumor susceptibility gene 101 protein n=1 Tax=Ustilago trichophora TaxID=86804 RepID=A0A5C3E3C0_9BASI|nr:related to Tumor susceptibility gene 101 protein [Ustilago trichophora]